VIFITTILYNQLCVLVTLITLDITQDITLATYPAHILASGRQLLTSSTLSWADISQIQSGVIPGERVVPAGHSAVCRVRDGDKLRPGRTDRSGLCMVEGVKKRQYQVLVDMTGKARLEWRKWNMFSNPEKGTVAYNQETFVAQMLVHGRDTTVGDLDFTRGLNGEVEVHLEGGKVERSTEGLALVELEPVKYRLENISFMDPKEMSSTVVEIGSVHLANKEEEVNGWQEEQEVLFHTYQGYEYWTHIPGTVRGLPSSAMVGKTLSYFRWGLEDKKMKTEKYEVRRSLYSGTSVNITVRGRIVRKETPYTAQLVMVYRDGSLTRHNVSSTFISALMEYITQDTSGPYFLKTGLPAPTTTARPSTTNPPTTPPTPSAPPHAHMFLAPTPTPTLFPPPPSPVTKPNPLKQFYPETEEPALDNGHSVADHVRVTVISSATHTFPLLSLVVTTLLPHCNSGRTL